MFSTIKAVLLPGAEPVLVICTTGPFDLEKVADVPVKFAFVDVGPSRTIEVSPLNVIVPVVNCMRVFVSPA